MIEDLFFNIIGAVPILIVGLFMFYLGHNAKKDRINKHNNSIIAMVTKVEEDKKRFGLCYIHLKYIYNGCECEDVVKCYSKYHLGTKVRVYMKNGKPKEILSDIPRDIKGQESMFNLHADTACFGIAYFLFFTSFMGIFSVILDYVNNPELFVSIFYIFLLLVLLYFVYRYKKRFNNLLDNLKTDKYELIHAKVVNTVTKQILFKKKSFPVIEYTFEGFKYERVVKGDIEINSFNETTFGTVDVYKNIETGKIEISSEINRKIDNLKKLTNLIIILILILIVFYVGNVL